jgi:hypothetical protein
MEFEIEDFVIDVSEHFWPFVELMIHTNGSDDIRTSEAYIFFGDILSCRLSIQSHVLFQDDSVADTVYTFDDFNKLMYNCRAVLQRHRKIALAQKVQQALDIMCTQIELEHEIDALAL